MSRNDHFAAGMLGLPAAATARDIVANFSFSDQKRSRTGEAESAEDLMARKYASAERKGIVSSILEKGYDINQPIEVAPAEVSENWSKPDHPAEYRPPYVVDGHHRIAVMHRHFPDMPIPLN
jgi:hypothetical protein